eukprot:TRINITY_DN7291_c0_g1_i1.p1 TRINITY_DN7291_c0_g1~~TRINITY_DN7291_c0_g1_i1.p1  ORF type:complete len:467 (-),score=45.25 TRINITY_DN7291_c0_g1_i1:133-1500(-)
MGNTCAHRLSCARRRDAVGQAGGAVQVEHVDCRRGEDEVLAPISCMPGCAKVLPKVSTELDCCTPCPNRSRYVKKHSSTPEAGHSCMSGYDKVLPKVSTEVGCCAPCPKRSRCVKKQSATPEACHSCTSGYDKVLPKASKEVVCCASCPKRSRCVKKQVSTPETDQSVSDSGRLQARYHRLSRYSSIPGYCGNLNDEHVAKLNELEQMAARTLGSLSPWLLSAGESQEQFLLRFLRARKFDIPKAFAMLKADVEWRRAQGLRELAHSSDSDVLGPHCETIRAMMPWKHIGSDQEGRPIIAKHIGCKFNIPAVLKKISLEEVMRYHVWQQESCCKLLSEQSRRLGVSVEQFIIVLDASGWHWGLATCQALQFLRSIAAVDSDHYPERLAYCVVVNASPQLTLLWKLVKKWLTPRQQAKFRFCATKQEAAEVMLPQMDASVLPKDLGGRAPPLGFVA